MKAKAKAALECETGASIYARRKVEVESVFGHIKDNRSFCRFSLRGIKKVHTEFGIVALTHFLKVAGILLANFRDKAKKGKQIKRNTWFCLSALFKGLFDSPFVSFLADRVGILRFIINVVTRYGETYFINRMYLVQLYTIYSLHASVLDH
ncbi:transposase [Pseudalkalibacillus sp. A8]|uniref:transposase n=1 Tax=Pseudalkalibacillus sp. A8 TaxID=3382641 RepID=UPI0038B4C9EF